MDNDSDPLQLPKSILQEKEENENTANIHQNDMVQYKQHATVFTQRKQRQLIHNN